MIEEKWVDIKGFEGDYVVSNIGRIKSLKNNRELIMKLSYDKDGYLFTSIYKNKKYTTIYAHRIVAISFLNHNSCGLKIVVDHINGIKTDNRVENLQLISQRLNSSKDKYKYNYTSNFVGVYLNNGKYRSSILYKNKRHSLGTFNNELDANIAYERALNEINNGTFKQGVLRKGYYYCNTFKKFKVRKKGLPRIGFNTEKEVINYLKINT